MDRLLTMRHWSIYYDFSDRREFKMSMSCVLLALILRIQMLFVEHEKSLSTAEHIQI